MKQKILVIMCMLMLCIGAKATFSVSIGVLIYNINTKQNYAEVTGGGENDTYLYIPSEITYKGKTYPVVKISAGCFKGRTRLKKVSIPSTVTYLGDNCFKGCNELISINIPTSVTSLGDNCFDGCNGLTSINIPSGITYLGKSCFRGCHITSISIPSTVTSLGDSCFANTSLTSVEIPQSIKNIGKYCFSNSDLKSVSIPSTITRLEEECFSYCYELTSVTIPPSVVSIGNSCFEHCWTLSSITLPSSVTYLGERCFHDSGLTSITLSTSLKSLERECFAACKKLTTITLPPSVESIGDDCFYYCVKLTSVTLSSSIENIGKRCFYDCRELSSIYIPSSIESIGEKCFADASLYEVTCMSAIPPTIGYQTFSNSSYSALFVPKESVEKYKSANYWKDFKYIYPADNEIIDDSKDTKTCEAPTIGYANNKLVFNSPTPSAEYHYTVKAADNQVEAYSADGEAELAACYNISCYATADGYKRSQTATAKLYWISANLVTDGITPDTPMRGVVITTDGGIVTLSGLSDGERVALYTVAGMKIGEAKAVNGSASIATTDKVVIARIGTQTIKVKM